MKSSTTAEGWFGQAGHHHAPGQHWIRAMAAHKRDGEHTGPSFGRGPFGRGRHGFPFGPFGHDPRRGGRMRRGDVRAAILALLVEMPYNGYQIIQEIERRSEGLWKPSAGSVYPALQQLEDEGLIAANEGGTQRKYALTEDGRAYAAAHEAELAAPWKSVADSADESWISLFDLVRQVGVAVMQVGQAGTKAQIDEAQALLVNTRRQLYGILARDEQEKSEQTQQHTED
jgi:DNA-binding PadR family transcriptional regulator